MPSRRSFLTMASSLALTPFFTVSAFAQSGATQVLGVYRRGVGDVVVTALLDGYLPLDPAMLNGADAETKARLLEQAFLPGAAPVETSVNGYVVESGDRTVLVDGGAGGAFGPTLGKMTAALAAAGYAPEDIDTIFCTHLHPDHIGAFTDENGAAAFPNADFMINAAEQAFWRDDANFAGAGEMVQSIARAAQATLTAYNDRLAPVGNGSTVAQGVTTVHLPGHTPGHTGLIITSGDASLLIWADIVHVGPIQFGAPQATIPFDVDQEMAAATRARIFDQVAIDRLEVAGAHIDFPSFGRLVGRQDGYAFVPSRWDHEI